MGWTKSTDGLKPCLRPGPPAQQPSFLEGDKNGRIKNKQMMLVSNGSRLALEILEGIILPLFVGSRVTSEDVCRVYRILLRIADICRTYKKRPTESFCCCMYPKMH